MTTTVLTLADFLLARIEEDEALAQFPIVDQHLISPRSRLLLECEAKRRIVAEPAPFSTESLTDRGAIRTGIRSTDMVLDWVLRRLALPYVEHADYREEWRP